MKLQQQQRQRQSRKSALYLAVACSLVGAAQGAAAGAPSFVSSTARTTSLAFAATTTKAPEKISQKRERASKVRLFSRGPDTQLSSAASSLAYTVEDFQSFNGGAAAASTRTVRDPFDPEFRPSSAITSTLDTTAPWGPIPLPKTVTTTTKSAANSIATVVAQDAPKTGFHIFCDLDGVLVDFEAGVQQICRQSTAELAKTTMWQKIAQSGTAFFEHLPWTPDGPRLWQNIKHLKPTILTGVPDLKGSRLEKFNWCRRNLGMDGDYRHVDMAGHDGYNHANVNGVPKACPERDPSVTNIITCWSYNKHHESGRHAILIDDRIALKESWEARGGIFVHHTDTESTLRQLREIGVLEHYQHDYATTINSNNRHSYRYERPMP